MSGMLGAFFATMGLPIVTLAASYTVTDSTTSPTNANSRLQLTSTGDINSIRVTGGTTDLGDWVSPKAAAGGNYEAKSTVTSGSLSSDPSAGAWVALSSDLTWSLAQTTNGSSQAIFTLEIRRVGTSTTLASSTVTLNADRSP